MERDTAAAAEAMPDLEGVRHRWLELPGLRMHVAEAGHGSPVLLLHGWPQHWWEWRHVMGPLAGAHRVVAPDLRGAGWTETTGADGPGMTPQQLLDDVLALLDTLGLESVHLVAHDYSLFTAYRLCFDHPGRIRHLVALGPPPYAGFDPRMLKALPGLWFQPVVAAPRLGPLVLSRTTLARHVLRGSRPPGATRDDTDVQAFADRVRLAGHARAGSELYRSVILPEARRLMSGVWRQRRLTVPTVALVGALEAGVGQSLLDVPVDMADDLRVELVPGAGHYVADDRPDVVAERALALFAR